MKTLHSEGFLFARAPYLSLNIDTDALEARGVTRLNLDARFGASEVGG